MLLFGKKKREKDSIDERFEHYNQIHNIEKRYSSILKKHFSLIETYEKVYSTALKTGIDSPLMKSVIRYCKQDLELSSQIKAYCDEIGEELYTLPAYKRLAIIYTKQKKYDEAMQICEESIRIGNKPEEFASRKEKLEQMKAASYSKKKRK